MIITIIGIASITAGFFCVLGAYYCFQRSQRLGTPRTPAIVLGLFALLFLTVIPATSAVFFAATTNSY